MEYPPLVIIQTDPKQNLAMFELSLFDMIVEIIPIDWVFHDLGDGYFRLSPKEFLGDFFDQFNDGEKGAEKAFQEVHAKLKQFHSLN